MTVLSRRSILFVGSLLVLGACTSDQDGPEPQRVPSPDELLRRTAADDEARLIDMYAGAAVTHPDLAEPLAAFMRRHQEHRDAVGARVRDTPTPSATHTGLPTETDEEPAAAIAALAQAEAGAAEARRADCLRAEDGELARLLAAIAACEALHEASVVRL